MTEQFSPQMLGQLAEMRFVPQSSHPVYSRVRGYQRYIRRTRALLMLNLIFAHSTLRITLRRLFEGPINHSWTWRFENVVAILTASTPATLPMTARDIRTAINRVANMPLPRDVSVQPVTAGGVAAEWITTPGCSKDRVLLFLHGGGYVCGSPATHRSLIAELSRKTRMRALAIHYRLAPESPYPAALEDAWCAYWWLLKNGIKANQIVVAGDSAGGGLTMALLLAIRDAGLPLPAAGVGMSPWLDLALQGDTFVSNEPTDFLNQVVLRRSAELYLGDTDAQTPLASPLYADLRGLPPLLVQAGTSEMLYADSERFCRNAAEAGVDVTFEPWGNMIHVWHMLFLLEPTARHAINSIGRFVRRQVA